MKSIKKLHTNKKSRKLQKFKQIFIFLKIINKSVILIKRILKNINKMKEKTKNINTF